MHVMKAMECPQVFKKNSLIILSNFSRSFLFFQKKYIGHSIVSTCFGTFYILQSTFQSFLSPLHRIIRSILHLILWVPIPYSRIYLNYHSVSQVIVGCIMGLFIGIAIGIWILPNFYEYYISSPLSPSFFLSRKKKIQNL